jgi:hypothetical protein
MHPISARGLVLQRSHFHGAGPRHLDNVQEFESAAVGRGIELEIHGPHLVGMLSPVTPHGAIGWPGPLALPGDGPLQASLLPEPFTRLWFSLQPSRLRRR